MESNCKLSLPVSKEQALAFLANPSPIDLGAYANDYRAKIHKDNAFYAINAAITYSNICEALCPICSFGKKKGQDGTYLLSAQDVYDKAIAFSKMGAQEVHIIGGIYSELPLDYYLDIVRAVKKADKNLNLVAFTVSECALMARVSGLSLQKIFELLIENGVDALPGGGAEVFEDSVRKVISPNKLTGEEWLDAMYLAHQTGLKTNATMLYSHIETPQNVVDHLFMLRALQEKTGGFKAFVPLPYRQGKSNIASKNSSIYDLKICSLSRLILDNFPHIRVPITHFGLKFAQILLNFGADDIGGTHWSEEVAVSAGANKLALQEDDMKSCINLAGFKPIKSNSNYELR